MSLYKAGPRTNTVPLVTLTAGLLFATACGTSDELGEVKVEVQELNFCSEAAEVICHNMFYCCTGAIIERVLGQEITTDELSCRRDVELICAKHNYKLLHALEGKTARMLTDKANRCLEAFVAQEDQCFVDEPQAPWVEPCSGLISEGLVEVGNGCQSSLECVKDSYCGADKKCKALPQVGQPCPEMRCAEGLYCEMKLEVDSALQTCVAYRPVGASCASSGQCEKGLFCKVETKVTTPYGDSAGICSAKGTLGAPCQGDEQCDSASCTPGSCSGQYSMPCFRDSDCDSVCEGTSNPCQSEYDCGGGTCSKSLYSCYNDYDCSGSGDVCEKTACVAKKCEGMPSCGEKFQLTDYCEDSLTMFLGEESARGSGAVGYSSEDS